MTLVLGQASATRAAALTAFSNGKLSFFSIGNFCVHSVWLADHDVALACESTVVDRLFLKVSHQE